MRHKRISRRFGRPTSHRKSMFRNMAVSLFKHEVIKTTLIKAKELRRLVEPLITLAKKDTVAQRRLAFARLGDDEIVNKLFKTIGPRYKKRAGGYTRVLKYGFRAGDSAPRAIIELVDRKVSEKAKKAAKAKATPSSAPTRLEE